MAWRACTLGGAELRALRRLRREQEPASLCQFALKRKWLRADPTANIKLASIKGDGLLLTAT
jgi:hypothetical protein